MECHKICGRVRSLSDGKSRCGLSVCLSVGRSVVISRKAVSQKGKKRVYSGRFVMRKIEVRRKKAEGFHKYRKNAKTLGDVQSTPPQYNHYF